jgi:hypothetical protein
MKQSINPEDAQGESVQSHQSCHSVSTPRRLGRAAHDCPDDTRPAVHIEHPCQNEQGSSNKQSSTMKPPSIEALRAHDIFSTVPEASLQQCESFDLALPTTYQVHRTLFLILGFQRIQINSFLRLFNSILFQLLLCVVNSISRPKQLLAKCDGFFFFFFFFFFFWFFAPTVIRAVGRLCARQRY